MTPFPLSTVNNRSLFFLKNSFFLSYFLLLILSLLFLGLKDDTVYAGRESQEKRNELKELLKNFSRVKENVERREKLHLLISEQNKFTTNLTLIWNQLEVASSLQIEMPEILILVKNLKSLRKFHHSKVSKKMINEYNNWSGNLATPFFEIFSPQFFQAYKSYHEIFSVAFPAIANTSINDKKLEELLKSVRFSTFPIFNLFLISLFKKKGCLSRRGQENLGGAFLSPRILICSFGTNFYASSFKQTTQRLS